MTDLTITWNDARNRVGAAKYGKDWIESLSERDLWLIEQYHGMPFLSMMPGRVRLAPRAFPPAALQNEVAMAVDRQQWMASQHKYVRQWLQRFGWGDPHRRIRQGEFEQKIAESFSTNLSIPNETRLPLLEFQDEVRNIARRVTRVALSGKDQLLSIKKKLKDAGIKLKVGNTQEVIEKILEEPEFKRTRPPVGVRKDRRRA